MKKFMKYKYEALNSPDLGPNLDQENLGQAKTEVTDNKIEVEVPSASPVKHEINNNRSDAEETSGRVIKQDSNNNEIWVEVPPRSPRPHSDLDAKPEVKDEAEREIDSHSNERQLLLSNSENVGLKEHISEDQQEINNYLQQQNDHDDGASAPSNPLSKIFFVNVEYKTENGDVKPEYEENRPSVITPNITLSTVSSRLIDYINNFTVDEEDESQQKYKKEEVKENDVLSNNDTIIKNNTLSNSPHSQNNIITIDDSNEESPKSSVAVNKMKHKPELVDIKTELQLVFINSDDDSKKIKNLVPPTYCRDFIRGSCKRGSFCLFRHNIIFTECKELIVSRLCRDYMNDRCQRDACMFAHATHFEKERFLRTGVLPPHLITRLKCVLTKGQISQCHPERKMRGPFPDQPSSHVQPNLYPNPVALDRIVNDNTLSHKRPSVPLPSGVMLRIPPVIPYPPPPLPVREPIAPETLLPDPQPAQTPPPSSSGGNAMAPPSFVPPPPFVARPQQFVVPQRFVAPQQFVAPQKFVASQQFMAPQRPFGAHPPFVAPPTGQIPPYAYPEPVTLPQPQKNTGPPMRMPPVMTFPPRPLQPPQSTMPLHILRPPPPPPPEPPFPCPPSGSFGDGRPSLSFSPPVGPHGQLPPMESQQPPLPPKRQRCSGTVSTRDEKGPAPKKPC